MTIVWVFIMLGYMGVWFVMVGHVRWYYVWFVILGYTGCHLSRWGM